MVQGQKTGGSTRQAQHDAVAIADENMAVWMAGGGDNLELPAIEGVGRIGHFEAIARVIRMVEGGINIGYRSTCWIMLICGSFSSDECGTGWFSV
ncbi:MAG: hypothetical protein ACHP8B_18410 [Terriglobales bacterium]